MDELAGQYKKRDSSINKDSILEWNSSDRQIIAENGSADARRYDSDAWSWGLSREDSGQADCGVIDLYLYVATLDSR